MHKITIYTDGSCEPNPGPGGWACVLETKLKSGRVLKKSFSGHVSELVPIPELAFQMKWNRSKMKNIVFDNGEPFVKTTNNRMEVLSIIRAMQQIKEPSKCNLIIYSDSQWAINAIEGKWKIKENLDLVDEAKDLVEDFNSVRFQWVKGHSGNPSNELVDELSYRMIKERPINTVEKSYAS